MSKHTGVFTNDHAVEAQNSLLVGCQLQETTKMKETKWFCCLCYFGIFNA